MYTPLPMVKSENTMRIDMPMAGLYAVGVRDEGDYRAWVKTKGGGRTYSAWVPISEAFRVRESRFKDEIGQHVAEYLPVPPAFLKTNSSEV